MTAQPLSSPVAVYHTPQEVITAALLNTTLTGAAHDLGMKEDSVKRALARAGRADLVSRLTGFPALKVVAPVPAEPVEPRGDLSWQESAVCASTDPEAFFPDKGGSTREAKRVCEGCPVRVECLDYALDKNERYGIWGGLSERERRRVQKRAV